MTADSFRPDQAIIGRERELALIADTRDALVLTGSRGQGLTTLLDAAAGLAVTRGETVLRASGARAELAFPYSGLQQLLRPLRRLLATLPEAPAAALRAALSGAPDADRLRAGTAALGLLSAAAGSGRLTLCIDDAQWLDRQTVDVFTFIARRLQTIPARLFIAAHGPDPFESLDVARLEVAPLAPHAAERLLDANLPAVVRARALEAAQGNPLALTESPKALAGADEGAVLLPWLPMSDRLREAFGEPLRGLDEAASQALLVAALDERAPLEAVIAAIARLTGAPASAEAFAAAVERGIVETVGPAVEFAHPLLRSAVYIAAAPAHRQAAHLALAAAAGDDPERAVWQRALAADGADEPIADDLVAAATQALARGDYRRAAGRMRLAARLTAAEPARSRRTAAAAELAHELGAPRLSERLLDEVRVEQLDPLGQARLITLRWQLSTPRGGHARTSLLVALARDVADHGERATAVRLLWVAASELQARSLAGRDVEAVLDAIVPVAGDPGHPGALSIRASVDARGHSAQILAAVHERVATTTAPVELAQLGHAALTCGDPHTAARLLVRAVDGLRAQGRLTTLSQVLALSAWAHAIVADWDRAAADGTEAVRLTGSLRQHLWGSVAHAALAMVAGWRGDEPSAAEHAAAAEAIALPARAAFVLSLVQQARAAVALSDGRPPEALGHLRRPFDPTDSAYHPASAATLVGELAEAATTDDERQAVARLADQLDSTRSPRARVALAHARLVLADDADADAAFAAASAYTGTRWPFVDARMLLIHGMRLRRSRRLVDSREPLREAAARFAQLGATPWARSAERELAATAETSYRGEDVRLTHQELEIARMVALGLSNRDIAARLSLSPRTVGAHLAHIFSKLDVPSRAGIATALRTSGLG